jgi:hypothetical protein
MVPAGFPAGLGECFAWQIFRLSGMVAGSLEREVAGSALLGSGS